MAYKFLGIGSSGQYLFARFDDGFGREEQRFNRSTLLGRIQNLKKDGRDVSEEIMGLSALDKRIAGEKEVVK